MKPRLLATIFAAGALVLPGGAAGLPGNGSIVFAGSDAHIYKVDTPGGPETDLSVGFTPAWSPDGSRLAFVSGGVSVMNADGSDRRLLHAGSDRQPVWSPDGSRLGFVTEGTGGAGSLVVVDVASGEAHLLVSGVVQPAWPPSWSPDGTQLAYTETAALDVAAIRADGSGHRVIASGPTADIAPAWSPDGRQIAFLHGEGFERPSLHVVPAAGGSAERLSPAQSGMTTFTAPGPAWSPDGTRIAFTATEIIAYSRIGPVYSSSVHVVDAEGTLEHGLTRAGAVSGTVLPSWSPDGRMISFVSGVPFFMNADGTCETKLSNRPATSTTWQPVLGAPPAARLRCADLLLAVTHERNFVEVGGEETFQLTVKNQENETASGVRLEAPAPADGSFVSVTTDRGVCSLAGGPLSCQLGELAVGERANLSVVLRVAKPGLVSTTARVTANEPDGDQSNNVFALSIEARPCTLVARHAGDRLMGTAGADVLCGDSGADVIYGLAGNDTIDAGLGPDRVFPGPGRDEVYLRAGLDFADTRDGTRDVIDCGGERDLVLVDRIDSVNRNCDYVQRPQIHRCKTVGTMRSDELTGGAISNWVCALAGNDEIHTFAGNDAVDAGSGNDTLDGGKGRDLLLGGAGYDTIFARDGAQDRIRCGPHYDTVLADRLDVVARNCEHVVRR